LIELLSYNPIFKSTGQKPQHPVIYQLGAFLIRYGTLGSNVQWTSLKVSIGIGTVLLYCCRVSRALRELKHQFCTWPADEEQAIIMQDIFQRSGFQNCVGSINGSLICFDEKPHVHGKEMMARKGYFGTAVQTTVNNRVCITSSQLGFSAAVTDSCMLHESHFFQNRHKYLKDGHKYLKDGQYVLADKGLTLRFICGIVLIMFLGYPSTSWTI
ncbi:hypothetical protein CYLTODRAFT_363350, partial [Cylindrobasidium torrendii FP15055 ss-10]